MGGVAEWSEVFCGVDVHNVNILLTRRYMHSTAYMLESAGRKGE